MAKRGIRTAIVERSDYSMIRTGETLSPSIRSSLINLGVWRHFLKDGHIESFAIRSVWGSPQPLDSSHIFNPYGSGWHVDRVRFDHMLITAAVNAGTTLFTDARIMNLSHYGTFDWQASILQRKSCYFIRSAFLIDAAGRSTANFMGFPRSFHVVDRLIGIVRFLTRVTTEPYALVEAMADGWWYSAPLSHDRLVVALMTDADLIARSGYVPYDYWIHQLAVAPLTSARAGQQISLAESKIVSAASVLRNPLHGTDWLAAGDASIAFDPISGQGVYNALRGGVIAAEAVMARFDGSSETFTEYSRWINSQFLRYLQMRSALYRKEQRWPHSLFWLRRQSLINARK
ncbi:MAG TPA: tryptophan 7-halogenase [Nitrososphaeraceae archaeon]